MNSEIRRTETPRSCTKMYVDMDCDHDWTRSEKSLEVGGRIQLQKKIRKWESGRFGVIRKREDGCFIKGRKLEIERKETCVGGKVRNIPTEWGGSLSLLLNDYCLNNSSTSDTTAFLQ